MRKIVYCKKCGFIGSIDENIDTPNCNNCKTEKLLKTDVNLDDWLHMTALQKENLKEEWQGENKSLEEGTPIVEHSKQEFYLLQIAENTRKTKNWVTFWSVIGIILLVILLFSVGFAIFHYYDAIKEFMNLL